VVRLEFKPPLPDPFSHVVVWAKCDMLATVSFARLDMFRTDRDQYGKRKFLKLSISINDLQRVRHGVKCALGIE
jgi:uncharacterized protein YifN (PemK superfamily)